jgi:hypothetical protein
MQSGVNSIGLPPRYNSARLATQGYWPNANLRIVLNLGTTYSQTRGTTAPVTVPLYQIEVENVDGSVDLVKTAALRSFMHSSPGSIFYNDVPIMTAGSPPTLCTTYAQATSYVTPTYAPPTGNCSYASVATAAEYAPAFQANSFVYREADFACRQNPTAAACSGGNAGLWALTATSSGDQLGNGAATAIGDYRRGGFYNNRENKWIYMLNVDLQQLLAWNMPGGAGAGQLFDSTSNANGGTVLFLSVVGPNSAGINNYGVRLFDSSQLPGYPLTGQNPLGITVGSDQAMYVEGNYNNFAYAPTNTGPTGIPWTHPPAAIIGDTMNILSQNWESTAGGVANDQKSATGLATSTARTPSNTTIYAAFAAGVDSSGNSRNTYNGGLENYPRLHELWGGGGGTITYRGSFVSLTTPLHQNGKWFSDGTAQNMYTVPTRNWDFDVQLNDLAMLPPMTPTFVYVNQMVVAEDFR